MRGLSSGVFFLSLSLSLVSRCLSHHVDVHINTKPSPERRRKCVCQTQRESFSAVTSRVIGSSIKLCSNSPSNRGGFELSSICLPFRGLATRGGDIRVFTTTSRLSSNSVRSSSIVIRRFASLGCRSRGSADFSFNTIHVRFWRFEPRTQSSPFRLFNCRRHVVRLHSILVFVRCF